MEAFRHSASCVFGVSLTVPGFFRWKVHGPAFRCKFSPGAPPHHGQGQRARLVSRIATAHAAEQVGDGRLGVGRFRLGRRLGFAALDRFAFFRRQFRAGELDRRIQFQIGAQAQIDRMMLELFQWDRSRTAAIVVFVVPSSLPTCASDNSG